jgi:hypothetical protein
MSITFKTLLKERGTLIALPLLAIAGFAGAALAEDSVDGNATVLATFKAQSEVGKTLHALAHYAGQAGLNEKIYALALPKEGETPLWAECEVKEVFTRVEVRKVPVDCVIKSGPYTLVEWPESGLSKPFEELPLVSAAQLLKALAKTTKADQAPGTQSGL